MVTAEALKPLFSVKVTIDTIEFQRRSYNDLYASGNTEEARQQLKAIQAQLQSIMTAYNSTLDNLNAAIADLPQSLEPFMEVQYA